MKRKILKVIGISFLIFAILSWIIPIGTYSGGKLETSSISPIGLVDLINTPISAVVTFALYAVVFAVIGGFYGVLEETGVLGKIANGWSIRFEGREKSFLVISIIVFSVLSSLTGLVIPLFVLVPLFAAAIFKMGFDKITALASTVGGILVGSIGSTYGFNITGYTKNLLSLDMNNQIWARVIILIILVVLLCVTVVLSSKKGDKKEKDTTKDAKVPEDVKQVKEKTTKKTTTKKTDSDSKKTTAKKADSDSKKTTAKKTTSKKPTSKTNKSTKKTTKKSKSNTKAFAISKDVKVITEGKKVSAVPFAIIFILMLIIAFIGMYNWFYSFNISLFKDIHEAVMGVEISKFKIFENLFSGATQFGYWSNVEFAGLLVFTSFVIKLVYKMKFNDYIEAFIGGVKKWIPTAIYAALANVILVVLYQAMQGGAGTMVDTIMGTVMKSVDGFNPFVTGFSALLGSFFFNDLYYLLADMSSFITSFDSSSLSIAGVLAQSVYAVAMMIFPTSIVLIAGLSLFDVSYGKWMKYIWKFALIALLLVMLVCGILTLM